jgi:hypothetical protein
VKLELELCTWHVWSASTVPPRPAHDCAPGEEADAVGAGEDGFADVVGGVAVDVPHPAAPVITAALASAISTLRIWFMVVSLCVQL